jgi:hypothetical protein
MENTVGMSTEEIVSFLEPSGLQIETYTPTAWGGHIPFMFCLVNYMRPRKYVELGSHYGASFFAVCQAIKQYKISCEATAIDLWQGDEHAGIYDESVYKDFTWLLNSRYPEIGVALRKDFNEAVKDFANESIDLLHIDGLHTYEAVKNDYNTWLPKMSKNGVILFHDTVVMERGFGVWKFWDEIKGKYPSFNFTHTHGLGVIVLGTSISNPVFNLINEVNQSEAFKRSFDNFFTLSGERAVSDALLRLKLQENHKDCSLKLYAKNIFRRMRKVFLG